MADATRMVDGVEIPAPGVWEVDPAHSRLGFVARHLMVTKVRGSFDVFDGRIAVGERPEDSSVAVRVDTASITTGSADRDTHLKSADFLDVERFPTMTFRSTKVERNGDAGLRLEGELTVRDVTRPVTLDAEFDGLTDDPWGGKRVAFTATTEIDREDWGMTWNVALEKGGVLVSKKVQIEIDVQAKYVAAAASEAA
ncbi:MAG TPA: YceI family protein [Actinomycetota bacterium]|jgi:polyisoprenoid-binding protein YceI